MQRPGEGMRAHAGLIRRIEQAARRGVRVRLFVPHGGGLAGGVPFVSDADLEAALKKERVKARTADAALDAYRDARITGLKFSLAILAVLALIALFYAPRIPTTQPGAGAKPQLE